MLGFLFQAQKSCFSMDLYSPIEKLRSVGPRNLPRLNKLGIKTVKDLLWHFPARYDDYTKTAQISDIEPGEKINIQGEIIKIDTRRIFPRRMTVTNAIVKDQTSALKVVWFNQPYVADQLTEGTFVSLAGKVHLDKHGLYLSNPSYEKIFSFNRDTELTTESESEENQPIINYSEPKLNLIHTGGLVPIYPETDGISSKYLRFLIKPILKNFKIEDHLPPHISEKYHFPRLDEAIQTIHFPKDTANAAAAKERLAFDDLMLFQLKALIERRKLNQLKSIPVKFNKELVQNFISGLPFELTADQKIAAWEIFKDLEKSYPMNRLLEGDVGSGKTVVALMAAVQTAFCGQQTVFMAPTEVLAQQHLKTITSLIGNRQRANIGLLTGSEAFFNGKKVKKTELKKAIADGTISIIIGTHAVIQKDVFFKNLALVVIDEQHRFGIGQRSALIRGTNAEPTQNDAEENLIYEKLSFTTRGLLYEVKKKLGLGHKEIIYQKAFEEELKEREIKYTREKQIPILYNGKKIGVYQPDFVVDEKIIIEFKSIPFLGSKEKKQLWAYLKSSEYRLAFLVNFGSTELEIQRIVYDTARISASVPQQSALVPHLLSMTATPIPRTLALTIYGDLDISIIKEKPKNRKKIITSVVPPSKIKTAYDFIKNETAKGRQVFIVCPRIEQGEATVSANSTTKQLKINMAWADAKAVEEEYKKLSQTIFPDLKIAMLHGKMKPKDKNRIMEDFKNLKYDILVSTSVIEVGVDIPNASVMVIESAERFGLTQLHQFRGRVGRDEHQSYCLLFSSTTDKTINKRLKALIECDDGFVLAEKDMAIRGPGEFFGVKQSGLPDLAMASLANVDLIKKARFEARALLKSDPSLKKYPALAAKLESFQRLTHFE